MSKLKELKEALAAATNDTVIKALKTEIATLENDNESHNFETIRSMLNTAKDLGASLSGQGRDFDHFGKDGNPTSAIFRATTGEARILIVKNWASESKSIIPNATLEDVAQVTKNDFVTPLYKGSLSNGSQYYQRHGKTLTDQPNIGWFGMLASTEIIKDKDYLCEFNDRGYVASAELKA